MFTIRSLMLTILLAGVLMAGNKLNIGQTAPDFSLPDAGGKMIKLSDYRGKLVVLYFYPKDDTPGCTAEACNLRDNYEALLAQNIAILGISYDDPQSHQKFIKKYNLPFPLLSDTTKKVAEMYGAKSGLFGRLVANRITYLIDQDGKILHVFDDVDTKNHTRQILDALKSKQK